MVCEADEEPDIPGRGIASRLWFGLALYRADAADPFGEADRFLRNQLIGNQFEFVELPVTRDATKLGILADSHNTARTQTLATSDQGEHSAFVEHAYGSSG